MLDETLRISPREVIFPESFQNHPAFSALMTSFSEKSITFLNDSAFDYARGYERLLDQFKTHSLEGFGCEKMKTGIRAAGAVVFYVRETQKQKIEHVTKIGTYVLSHYLMVDDTSCRNLELLGNIRSGGRKGTLIDIIDRTVTAMGGRLLKRWVRYPLVDAAMIQSRLDAVQEVKNKAQVRRDVRELLENVYDLERLSSKITMGHANARDLTALKHSLASLPPIWMLLSQFESCLFKFEGRLDNLHKLADLIGTGYPRGCTSHDQ